MANLTENLAPESDSYPCRNCGATLKYKPGTTSLHCDYCSTDTPIEAKVASVVKELDFEKYAQNYEQLNTGTSKVIGCRKCGGESAFDGSLKSVECPYCGSPLIESDIHEERLIRPSYLLPFRVADKEIQSHMRNWLAKRWFAPNKLKSKATHTNRLQGVYIPSWTYDARTYTHYTGQRGHNYRVTVGSGKNRRTETRTRWSHCSGSVSLSFDDILVSASKIITSEVMNKLNDWDKMNLVEVDNRFLSGFITEKYGIDMHQGYEVAKNIMNSNIQRAIKQDIGGDHQRINSSRTAFSNVKFKLILLPVYMSSYMYKNKVYHFFVNGRTGKVTGDRPYSAIKIVLAIIAGLVLIIMLAIFFSRS